MIVTNESVCNAILDVFYSDNIDSDALVNKVKGYTRSTWIRICKAVLTDTKDERTVEKHFLKCYSFFSA